MAGEHENCECDGRVIALEERVANLEQESELRLAHLERENERRFATQQQLSDALGALVRKLGGR